ncbi:Beta-hydroxybutyrate dehydrogenase [Heterostelium album PN500]|uniref:3-oxoacyl-[acyl-carrier-protein] reductase n=1 Tax=Heterostelium pallidum (strain ATCC 26659 / Pp 5 / PN500) TaxID=670386 RepID=D3BR72_HETP5|nr:Beta-hydroxybutyrate dehydrogenase [Heterostelium album PN500]EFA75904.1 Beta-hydroxybutyrate dehydrogenase [Heterostelium album PN500]|eukprot:XP_020428038.1 Beta-hydroxybutyrate dehydrogenase [Heterostelium album PN500]
MFSLTKQILFKSSTVKNVVGNLMYNASSSVVRSYSSVNNNNNNSNNSDASPLRRMNNKVCFVTGGAAGIGLGIVERFLKEGGKVAVADLNGQLASDVATKLDKQYPGSVIAIKADITQEEDVRQGIEKTVAKFGGLDVVVSNAGFQHIEALEDLPLEMWKKMLAVHLDGSFLCAKHAIRQFKKDTVRGGSIIFIGSVHSKVASDLKSPYVTAKHGLEGLNRSVAREAAKYNVRSNLLCPGFVRTALVERQIPQIAERMGISEDQVIKSVMLKDTLDGEFTSFEDVNEVAVTFVHMPSKALTGQSVIVSHGWVLE